MAYKPRYHISSREAAPYEERSTRDILQTKKHKSIFSLIQRWSSAKSLWPIFFGESCCLERNNRMIKKTLVSERFDSETVSYSPRQADLLVVSGLVTNKQAPILKEVYDQMPAPKWVVVIGACACSGGAYRTYNTKGGISSIIPVDVYIPGCPSSPESIEKGLKVLKEKIMLGGVSDSSRNSEEEL
jgi:NADH-quinone oxidoreductase subunit B